MATNKNKRKLRAPKVADSELSRVITDIYDEINKLSGGPSEAASQTVKLVTQSQLPLNPTFNVVTANEFIGNLTGDVIGDLTGAIHVQGKNETGNTLTKGTPVYISGQSSSGQNFTIDVADSDDSGKMPAIGILSADVNNNAQGDIVTHGKLIGIDTSSFTVGDELYVSSSGTLVNTPPTGESNLLQKIAKVVRVDASSGQIYIMGAGRTNAVPNLNQGAVFIGDANNQAVASTFSIVNESTPSNGGSLAYSNGTFTFTPADIADLTGYIDTISTSATSGLFSSESNGTVTMSLDVNALTEETTVASGDFLALSQSGNTKKVALSNIDLSLLDNSASGFIDDYTVTQADVTQHQSALAIAESQITFTSSFIELADLSVAAAPASGGGSLSYDNAQGLFTFTPASIPNVSSFITLADLSVGIPNQPSGSGAISYSSANGVFTYTPPDLSSYLTSYTETNDLTSAVTWADVPDANITSSSVTQHIVIGNPQTPSGGGALAFTNGEFIFTPAAVPNVSNFITLSDARNGLSVGIPGQASGSGSLSYSSTNGVFTYTPPDLSIYLTSETSHADVVVDGDFTANGLMKRTGAGTYDTITDSSSNWDTAYGWGDHSTAGYLTSYTETDPVFIASPAGGIATTDITNWNAAYSYSQVGHLQIANNLSDVNDAATSRTNLGLGATDNVTFGTLELGNNTSVNGTIKMWLSSIPDDANITLDNNAGVARFRLDSDTVVEGDLWVDNEVTTARLRTPEITNLAGTAAIWSTSSAVWDTSSLTWTNDVILLNGGISISDTLEVINSAEFQANATVNNNLTVLGTTNLASVTSSALTAGRVVLAGTSGVLEDSANLTFNGSLLDVTGQVSIDDSAAISGNSFEVLGSNGNIRVPYTGETIQLTATTGNASINSGSNNLEINAAKTLINQATDVDGALYALTTLTVDGQTNLNSKLVVSDSTASPGDYAIEATSNGALTANFNSTHPDQGGISISSFSTSISDLIYDSTIGVALRAHANSNLSFYTEATGVDTLRLKISNGTGISAFYGEQFNFGDSSGNSGKVKLITGASGQGEFILNQGGVDQTTLSWDSTFGNFNVASLGNILYKTQGSTNAGMWDNGDLKLYQSTFSDNFTKGTGNTGWVVDGSAGFAIEKDGSSLYNAYFDTLTVRGTLRVFELIAKQISTIGGTEIMSVANGVIESVSGTAGFETVTLEDPNNTNTNSFASGDLVVIQRFNPNNPGTLVKSEWREVVTTTFTTITLQDSSVATSLSGAPSGSAPTAQPLEPGDYIVAFGNWNTPSVRGNLIYRSVLGNPIVRVQENIKRYSEFTNPINHTRIAYGDIGGFGGLSTGTYGFFAGTDTDNHVTITSTGMQFRNASDVLAELASNKFVVGDSTSYVRFDGATSKIEMAADTFNLATTNLIIDSLNEIITLGTGVNEVSVGKIGTTPADQFGISLDATNYWYNSGGNTYISIGSASQYLQFDTSSGNLDIKANNFVLESGDLAIKSTGTTYPNASISSITSYTSGVFTFANYQQFRTIQSNKYYKYQFEYDLSDLANFQADFTVEFMKRTSGVVTPLSAFDSIIVFQNQQYFQSVSTSGATLTITDISTSSDTKFKINSPSASDSTYQGRITMYIQILDNAGVAEIGLRFANTHSGGSGIDCELPELDFVEYNPATELNPSGTFTRLADSIIIANGREYQKRTLIVNE